MRLTQRTRVSAKDCAEASYDGKIHFPTSAQLTAFEWDVLKATLSIPMGETRTYQWIAQQIGRPKAVRAVGQALRKNPFPLLIPCHRVINSDGKLGGYAGQYDGKKASLLAVEQKIFVAMKEKKD